MGMWKESLENVLLLCFVRFTSSWLSSRTNNRHHSTALCFQLSREMPQASPSWTGNPLWCPFHDFPLHAVWERGGTFHAANVVSHLSLRGWTNGKSGHFPRTPAEVRRSEESQEGGGRRNWSPALTAFELQWEEVSGILTHAGLFSASKYSQAP